MRVILGLDRPDADTAPVGGRPYRALRHPLTHLGSLIDASALHEPFNGMDPEGTRVMRGFLRSLAAEGGSSWSPAT